MMKKIALMALAISLVLTASAFATSQENGTAGAVLTLTSTKGSIDLSFSPQVKGVYVSDGAGTADSIQWYAIGTYHTGGTKTYATASNLTSIYYKKDTLDFAGIPTQNVSASEWSTGLGWQR